MKVDCSTLPQRLAEICRGEALQKGARSIRQFTLEERTKIISLRLRVPVSEIELPEAPVIEIRQPLLSNNSSGIGYRLHEIIKRETGQQVPCGDCKKAIDALNSSTPEQVYNNREELAEQIVERAKVQAKKWWQRWAVTLAPGLAKRRVLGWIDEAIHVPLKHLDWAYGLTAVKERLDSGILDRTLASLKLAGFDRPRLFIDGDSAGFDGLGLEITRREQLIRPYGNWLLALLELYIRDPYADRYALFQDDFVTCIGLREYLDNVPWRDKSYLNLYTFPHNQPSELIKRWANNERTHPELNGDETGFYRACQNGKGAVALVFDQVGVKFLLTRLHMYDRIQNPIRGHKAIDGAVVEAMRQEGWIELVHNPSLVQHIGDKSSMGNPLHEKAVSFPGEGFDLRTLLRPTLREV